MTFPLVARRVAKRDKVYMASAPQQTVSPYCNGMHDQPSSEHLASLELYLCTSVAIAADPPVKLASSNLLEFYVGVTGRSKAAGLSKSQ